MDAPGAEPLTHGRLHRTAENLASASVSPIVKGDGRRSRARTATSREDPGDAGQDSRAQGWKQRPQFQALTPNTNSC